MSLFKAAEGVNLEATAQRTDILHFVDVTKVSGTATGGEAVYHKCGAGFLSMTESPSAQTKSRKYINEKSERENITRYKPTFAFESLLMFNNPIIRMIYDIYKQRKTGSDTIITMITVDAFDVAVSGSYPAYKGNYAVQVSSCDDDDDMVIKGNLACQGDEIIGWFNPETGVWSETEPTTTDSGTQSSGDDTQGGEDDEGTT